MDAAIDWSKPIKRASDGRLGQLIYLDEIARAAVVQFDLGDYKWRCIYCLDGIPLFIHQEQHRLVNA